MKQGTFFVKLCELNQDYETMQSCLRVCQALNPQDLHREMTRIKHEYSELQARLENYIHESKSPAISALAEVQNTYYQSVKKLTEEELPSYFHSESNISGEEEVESKMLYAEYSIDFARQSIYHALLSVFSAIDMERLHNTDTENIERKDTNEGIKNT